MIAAGRKVETPDARILNPVLRRRVADDQRVVRIDGVVNARTRDQAVLRSRRVLKKRRG